MALNRVVVEEWDSDYGMKIVYRRDDTEQRAVAVPSLRGPALSARGKMCVSESRFFTRMRRVRSARRAMMLAERLQDAALTDC